MIVCHCHNRSDRKLNKVVDRLVRHGERDADELVDAIGVETGAGTDCGGCVPAIESIVDVSLRRVRGVAVDEGLDDAVGM